MPPRKLHRLILFAVLLWPFYMVLPSIDAQPLPFYKSEKVIVGESWLKNINTIDPPRILKSPQVGHATFNKAGKGYLLHYDNRGIAEYDSLVFTADGEIHAYALKNQFLRSRKDYFITEPGSVTSLNVLGNDGSYSNIHLSNIPFEEGIHATIQNDKVRLEAGVPGLYHFYYTACDESDHCDEAKVTVFVMDPNLQHDTIVLSEVLEQQVTLPLPNADFELVHSSIEHVYPDGEGFFDVDLFQKDEGENEILFQNPQGRTLLYKLNFVDKWGENRLNTSDKVYLHPDKSVNISLTENDLWVNIYHILPTSSDLQVVNTGGGQVKVLPRAGFAGKTSFEYVTCAFPRCDTTTVEVYVDHFKPAKDQFDLFVDPSVPYHIPFSTPNQDYQLSIVNQPKKGTLEVTDLGHSLRYLPGSDFSGEDKAKIKYSYQNGSGDFESVHYIRFLRSPHPFQGKCTDCVWPGDTDGNGIVDMADIRPIARYAGEKGPLRSEGALWKGQWSYPWMNFEDEKLNHYDADGDGLISMEDLQIIVDYFGNAHGLYTAPVTWLDIPVVIGHSKESVSPGDELVFEFTIGDQEHKLYNVTGFSTDVRIEGQDLLPGNVEVVRDEKTWLKSHQPTMTLKTPGSGSGEVTAGEFRVRSVGVKGFGTSMKLHIIVEDEVEGFRTLRAKSKGLKFIFRNLMIHTENEVIPLPDQIIELPRKPDVKPESTAPVDLQVFPNPARDHISVRWPAGSKNTLLEILDLTGKKLANYEVESKSKGANIIVEDLSPGMYILRCKSGEKVWNQKLTIIR